MQRGLAAALVALSASVMSAWAADDADHAPRRLYDPQTDCAVYAAAAFDADKASWDGPCVRGLASGRGTATFIGKSNQSETVSAEFLDGLAVEGKADLSWSDGAHYSGNAADGKPNGQGILIDAKGNKFDGIWDDGALNGKGSVVWTNGDRYDGDWADGKAEGHGVQVWADGQKYDGAWRNDLPNGQGTLTRKDGTILAGLFVDGKHQAPAEAAPSPKFVAVVPPLTPSPVAPISDKSANSDLLDRLAGKTLIGVDGSTIAFAPRDGGLMRTLTSADGSVQKAGFTFLGQGIGSVTDAGDPPKVGGVFRTTPAGVEADYADGHSELIASAADGVSITLKNGAGEQACAAWYPQGHVFSAEERRAAVAAYARRLGVSDATSAAPHASCSMPATAPGVDHRTAAPVPKHKPAHVQPASFMTPAPTAPVVNGLQEVAVRDSKIHLVDGPSDGGDTLAIAAANAPRALGDEQIASNCLKIDSDGAYWGFRNHCSYTVQFAYCLLHGTNTMTACNNGAISVPGSVSANGFGALFADDSLGERDVDHNFRWVGCKGGAGEVSAHLDAPDPATGHCVRAGRDLAQGN